MGCCRIRTSKGYRLPPFSVVTHLNGTAVKNLAHLVEIIRDAKDEFLTVDLAGSSPPVVFRRQEISRRHRRNPFRRGSAQTVFRRLGEGVAREALA